MRLSILTLVTATLLVGTIFGQQSTTAPRLRRVQDVPMLRQPSALHKFSAIALSVLRW